jgi:hypothetical protein
MHGVVEASQDAGKERRVPMLLALVCGACGAHEKQAPGIRGVVMPMTVRQRADYQAQKDYARWFVDASLPFSSSMRNRAANEGWMLCECVGSSYGRWQIQCIDCDPEIGDRSLEDDTAAWRVLLQENEQHHKFARQFIRTHNPAEWRFICAQAAKLKLDTARLEPKLVAELIEAVLHAA